MNAVKRIGNRLAARQAGDGGDPMAMHDEVMLALAMAALLSVVIGLSIVGAGAIARPLFMVSALVFSVQGKRRSPWLYLSASLWIWLSTAFVRRMIEWHSGFNPTDIVLVTPNLTALLIVPDILRSKGLLTRRGAGYPLLLTGCVLYGLCVSFVRGDVLGGAIAAADWLIPLLYLFLFICNAERIDEAEAHVSAFLTLSVIFVVPYSLYQYFLMPAWDAAWMINADMGSAGKPLPMGSRVFGPLNNPGVLAIWAATCIVWLSHFRNRLLTIATPLLFLVVALSFVRSVYGSLTLAIVIGTLLGRGGFGRLLVLVSFSGLIGYGVLAAANPIVADQIVTRLQTVQDLSSDPSAQDRQEVYTETPKLIDQNPFGAGIGSQGRGNAAHGGRHEASLVNIDSGPLSVYLALGWIAGTLYIVGMFVLQGRALLSARRSNSPVASAMAAAAICSLAIFPFINVVQFSGVILWICLGFVLAVEIRASTPAQAPARQILRAPAELARL
jgi:hypothetical protein